MSLIKSFNKNFLKENLRKSKGIIIFSLLIIPIITSLSLFSIGKYNGSQLLISSTTIGIINVLFMYILPIIYSFVLFGFSFKKKSTDFICSMPVNRKTIFITNTIGGIILITAAQLLTLLTVLVFSIIFKSLVVIGISLLENFLLIWLSYIFVFVAANLAMSFSGTFMTQIVSTVLILFLVPLCFDILKVSSKINNSRYLYDTYYSYEYDNYNLEIFDGNDSIKVNTLDRITNYTMPYKVIRYFGNFRFSYETIFRMILLGSVYFILGMILFERRHMEDNEQSFGNEKFHVLLKALTLLPMLLLFNLSQVGHRSTFAYVVVITGMAIYYFIFDYIVKRKMKFIKTIKYFITTVVIIEFCTVGLNAIIKDSSKKEVDLYDIKAISIGKENDTKTSFFGYNEDDEYFDGNYYIEDEELIQLFFDSMNDNDYYDNYRRNYQDDDYDYLQDETYTSYYDIYESRSSIQFNIKLKNGKKYSIKGYIKNKYYDKIYDLLVNDSDYSKNIIKKVINSQGKFEGNNIFFDRRMQSRINKELKSLSNDIDLKDLINEDNKYCITKNAYVNHEIVSYNIPVDLSEDLLQIVANAKNKEINKSVIHRYSDIVSITIYDKNGFVQEKNNYYSSNNGYFSSYDVLDFVEKNMDDKFDSSKSYYIIDITLRNSLSGYNYITFFTNKTSEFKNIINK